MKEPLHEVISCLEEINQDNTVPKNIRNKISEMISELKSSKDLSLKVNKSLNELEEICDDMNLQPFIRTQLWGVSSMLEKLQ